MLMMYNIHSSAIRWQIHDFLFDGNIMFPLSLTICKIFAKQEKCKTLTMKVKVKIDELKNGTCAIRLKLFDSILVNFFQNFS